MGLVDLIAALENEKCTIQMKTWRIIIIFR